MSLSVPHNSLFESFAHAAVKLGHSLQNNKPLALCIVTLGTASFFIARTPYPKEPTAPKETAGENEKAAYNNQLEEYTRNHYIYTAAHLGIIAGVTFGGLYVAYKMNESEQRILFLDGIIQELLTKMKNLTEETVKTVVTQIRSVKGASSFICIINDTDSPIQLWSGHRFRLNSTLDCVNHYVKPGAYAVLDGGIFSWGIAEGVKVGVGHDSTSFPHGSVVTATALLSALHGSAITK